MHNEHSQQGQVSPELKIRQLTNELTNLRLRENKERQGLLDQLLQANLDLVRAGKDLDRSDNMVANLQEQLVELRAELHEAEAREQAANLNLWEGLQ